MKPTKSILCSQTLNIKTNKQKTSATTDDEEKQAQND